MSTCILTCSLSSTTFSTKNPTQIIWNITHSDAPLNTNIKITDIKISIPGRSDIDDITSTLGLLINNTQLGSVSNLSYNDGVLYNREYSLSYSLNNPMFPTFLNIITQDYLNNSYNGNISFQVSTKQGTSSSESLVVDEGKIVIKITYEYLISPPTDLLFNNGSTSLKTSINSQIAIQWTKPTTGAVSNYNIYYNNAYLKQVAGSQTSTIIDIPGGIDNGTIWNIGLKSISEQGIESALSGTIALTIYQPIEIKDFCVKDASGTKTYESSEYQIGAYYDASNVPKCTFSWDYKRPDNDTRGISQVKFIDTQLTTTVKFYSVQPKIGTYYVEIVDEYGIIARSNNIVITEYVAKDYGISIKSPSAQADGRITTNSFTLTLPNDCKAKNLKYGYTNNNIINTITNNTFDVGIGINTKFNLYIKYDDPAPMGGYSSKIISFGSFYIYDFPTAPQVIGVQDEKYTGSYVYQNLKVFINPATKTTFSGSNFSYSITLNNTKTISGLTVPEGASNFLIVPLTDPTFEGLSDDFKVTGISVYDIDCAKTLQGTVEASPTELYRLKLPTVTIKNVSVQQEAAGNATNNKIIVNFTVSDTGNITGSTENDCKVKLSVGEINTTYEVPYVYNDIKITPESENLQSQSITIKLNETGSNLYKAVINNENPVIDDIITVSFSFDYYNQYSSQASSTFNYDFTTKPMYDNAFSGPDKEAPAIPMATFTVSSASAITFYDAAGGSNGYSNIELEFIPKDGSTSTKVVETIIGGSSFNCIYQSYSNINKTVSYDAVFTVNYASGRSYTYSAPFSVEIAKWTREQAQITKADENGIVFKFPSNTPCGNDDSFSRVDLTIGGKTTTGLTIKNNSYTYTWPEGKAPTTDTSYDITLTYYNIKDETIVQKFNSYIVHISGATVAIRKQFLGINVAEDYGTVADDLSTYPIITINSLKNLSSTTPILKIAASGNEGDGAHLLYFYSGTTDIGGFYKSGNNDGFIAENLLGIKIGNTITKFSDFLTGASASNTYLTKADAEEDYLKLTDAENNYLTKASAQSTYLTKTDAKEYYLTKGAINDSQVGTNLWTSNRITDYVTNKINQIPTVTRSTTSLTVPINDNWKTDDAYGDYYQDFLVTGLTSKNQEISISCIPCTDFPITAAKIVGDETTGYKLQIRMASEPTKQQTIDISIITIPQ